MNPHRWGSDGKPRPQVPPDAHSREGRKPHVYGGGSAGDRGGGCLPGRSCALGQAALHSPEPRTPGPVFSMESNAGPGTQTWLSAGVRPEGRGWDAGHMVPLGPDGDRSPIPGAQHPERYAQQSPGGARPGARVWSHGGFVGSTQADKVPSSWRSLTGPPHLLGLEPSGAGWVWAPAADSGRFPGLRRTQFLQCREIKPQTSD